MSVEKQQEKLQKPLVDLDGDSQDGTSEGMRCPKCRSARVQILDTDPDSVRLRCAHGCGEFRRARPDRLVTRPTIASVTR